MKLGIVGLTHLGLVNAICSAALLKQKVICFDKQERLNTITKERLPIFEPELDHLYATNSGNIQKSSDPRELANCNLIIVALDIHTNQQNESILDELHTCLETIVPHINNSTTLVIQSQVPVGEMRKISRRTQNANPNYTTSPIYWVETLVIGQAVSRYCSPERLIVGTVEGAAVQGDFAEFLALFKAPIHYMRYESAELTKEALNLYISLSVSYTNFMSDLSENYGARMSEMVPALKSDKRIGPFAYLQPGLGIAGGNLERDLINLSASARHQAVNSSLVDTVIQRNQETFHWASNQLKKIVNLDKHPTVACWGIAYKRDTSATKNSFAIRTIENLRDKVKFLVFDPKAQVPEHLNGYATQCNSLEQTLEGACAVIIFHDGQGIGDIDPSWCKNAVGNRPIIDCLGALIKHKAYFREENLQYICRGEGA